MGFSYLKPFSRRRTPQTEPIAGSTQVPNSDVGWSWPVDDWVRLDRFLVLGSEGGSFYASERTLTRQNARGVERAVAADGPRVVRRIVEISEAGRAPKNDPAIFALAMCAKVGDLATRRAAYAAVGKVCRTGTHLMHFAAYAEAFGGWGRGLRTAVATWYGALPASALAYQLVKYQTRDGWSNRDLLRLSHAVAPSDEHNRLYRWATHGDLAEPVPASLAIVEAFERAKETRSAREITGLIVRHDLPREAVPTAWLKERAVWEALLAKMPLGATIRNLGTMTRVGLVEPMSSAEATIVERLRDADALRRARVHPIAVLAALLTYRSGRGARGKGAWTPVGGVVDALDEAFYRTFRFVEPAEKRMLLALDVSGSMDGGLVAGVPGLTPRVASAAMALVTAATETKHAFVAFTAAAGGTGGRWGGRTPGITPVAISPRQRLDDVVRAVSGLPFGGTDCALPMIWARKNRVAVDVFVVYTDSETWAGDLHPAQALGEYRRATGIAAKLVVVGMVSNGFTIADPNDGGMLDVVGFDTATPSVIGDFARESPQQEKQHQP